MNQNAYSFQTNFIASSDSTPIVIYGLGKQTDEILTECDDDRIIGVLDGFREEGSFCGKPILALDDLAGKTVKIVIVARAASEKIVYRRIKDFCFANRIRVYNLSGEDLSIPKEVKDHPYFERSAEELLDKAKEYDAVSFDIFDTLLTRKISDRVCFYNLIAKVCEVTFPFAKLRLSAEMALSKEGCPRLNEIYDWMKADGGVSTEEADRLMQAELEFEEKNLLPRQEMVDLLLTLIREGMNVHLISDMYFPKEYIQRILDGFGITGYGELLVSCEYGTAKTGGLFEEYKKLVPARKYLHIGDSKEADGTAAEKYGIDTFLVKSAMDMAELTEPGQALLNMDHTEIVLGLIASRAFNSPFALYGSLGRVRITDPFSQGYAMLGPLMAGFTEWLIQKVQELNLERILFISRDGYLPKKVYELFVRERNDSDSSAEEDDDLPEAVYLYTSRILDVVASIRNEEDVVWASNFPFAGTMEEMLEKRFGLRKEQIHNRALGEDDKSYILRHAHLIIKYAAELRTNYRRYLENFNLKEGKIAIFDFVSTGTCHMGLERILGFELKGLYFDKLKDSDPAKQALNISAYVREIMPNLEMDNYFLLENWIKATHPSVRSVTNTGEIVFSESRLPEEQIKIISRIQDGALEFCRDICEIEKCGISIGVLESALKTISLIDADEMKLHGRQLQGTLLSGEATMDREQETSWIIYDEFTGRRIGE